MLGRATAPGAGWPAHLLAVADLSCLALAAVLDLAEDAKRDEDRFGALTGQTLACFVNPPAPDEPLAAAVAAERLGMVPVMLSPEDLELHDGEPIADAAAAVSMSASALLMHGFAQPMLKEIARGAKVPVINARSDLHRPCQALADLLALRERFGGLSGVRLAFVGDGGASIAHSLMEAGALAEMEIRVACPPAYRPDELIEFGARVLADRHGGRITVTSDMTEAVAGAHAVYTTAWVPPGREGERAARMARLRPYRVDLRVMKLAGPGAVFMHCLPAHRGEEVTGHVIDGAQSLVRQQALNHAPIHEALVYALATGARTA
jgi:ornithine carbamoyltransferase